MLSGEYAEYGEQLTPHTWAVHMPADAYRRLDSCGLWPDGQAVDHWWRDISSDDVGTRCFGHLSTREVQIAVCASHMLACPARGL